MKGFGWMVMSGLGLTLPMSTLAQDVSEVVNHFSAPIEVVNAIHPSEKQIVSPGERVSVTDQFSGQTDPKHPYFYIYVEHSNQELCATRYGKRDMGYLIVGADGQCAYSATAPEVNPQPEPQPDPQPMPVKVAPVIENIQDSVVLKNGQRYDVKGFVINPDGVSGAPTVTFDNQNSWLQLQHYRSGDQVVVLASGTPPSGDSTYRYSIEAVNSTGGMARKAVSIRVVGEQMIPRTISAWLYDGSGGNKEMGQFVGELNQWNKVALPENRITELYPYGSDMEMFGKLKQTYYITNTYNSDRDLGVERVNGPENARYYKKHVKNLHYISPIIDGRIDNGYLTEFNQLSKKEAYGYADVLAQQFCMDSAVVGPQVDVEPLDFTQPAQVHFYTRLVDDFQGNNLLTCEQDHRYTSVFTFASRVKQGLEGPMATEVKALLQQKNFLVIDSLYDLPGEKAVYSTVSQYKGFVKNEIDQLLVLAKQYNFNFKFGIPASCSFHECASDGNQIGYIKAALEAIGQANADNPELVCNNPHFKGIALWTFNNDQATWEGKTIHVGKPSQDVVNYMTKHASQVVGCSLNQ